jgi:hypothetical protein
VKIVEFPRGLDPAKLSFKEFKPDVLLIQNVDSFRTFAARLPAEWRAGGTGRYYELRVPAQ